MVELEEAVGGCVLGGREVSRRGETRLAGPSRGLQETREAERGLSLSLHAVQLSELRKENISFEIVNGKKIFELKYRHQYILL